MSIATARLKWLALPFILPFIPDPGARGDVQYGACDARTLSFDLDESAIEIGHDLSPSLELVVDALERQRSYAP